MLSENSLVKIARVARKKLEAAYTGVCEVREHVYATDAKTGLTRPQGAEKVVYEALPCRLSPLFAFLTGNVNAKKSDTKEDSGKHHALLWEKHGYG